MDPVDGIQFLQLELVDGAPRDYRGASQIAYTWRERDPMACLKFIVSESDSDLGMISDSVSSLVEKCLATDPEEVDALWKTATPALKWSMSYEVFRYWFSHDPARALAEAEQAPPGLQDSIWNRAASAADPAAMLEALIKTRGANRHINAVTSLIEQLTEKDLPAAQAAAAKLPPGPARTQACAEVVKHLAKKDPEAAWAWMEAEAPTNKNRREAAGALLEKDPLKAIALDPQANWWPKTDALDDYARDLAKTDWSAMVELAESVGPTLRDQILKGAAKSLSWEEGNPLPKLEQVGGLIAGLGGKGKKLNDSFFEDLNPAQAPAIATWLNAQPESVRDAFIEPMAERLQKESPATTAAWLAGLPPGEVRTEHLLRTTADWAGTDPSAAAAFSLTLPPGPDRDYAILNTALAWHRNAPQAARAWLDGLPDSPAKTRAVQELDGGRN